MLQLTVFSLLWVSLQCYADDYYQPYSFNHSTVPGISEYRSALTLDWLAHEDSRQRQFAHVFETEMPVVLHTELDTSDCTTFSRPATGKVSKLMLELLKNIEGDDGVIQELTQTLIRTKLLVETSALELEPNLNSLVHTPKIMLAEPHVTLPRILAVVWMLATDPMATKSRGWCPIKKLTEYLAVAQPTDIASRMRAMDTIISRVRFVLEEFITSVAPHSLKHDKMRKELRVRLTPQNNRILERAYKDYY